MPNYHLSSVKIFFCDFDLWPSAKAKGGKLREEIICLDFVDVFPSHILIFPDNIFDIKTEENQALIKNYSLIY